MKKRSNRTSGLSADEQAWLRGEKVGGFFEFNNDGDLDALFYEHGDSKTMFWRSDMFRPITLDDLKAEEDGWLNSGESDKYGFNSYFVFKYYSDAEKQTLWNKRGNKKQFRWNPGMRKPEAIERPT
jgi:hypothetical protein